MGAFRDADHLFRCIGGLFDWAKKNPEVGPKLRKTELVIRMNYKEPDAVMTADCSKDPKEKGSYINWVRGDGGVKAEVEFFMTADVAHRFWLGKVNLLIALAKKDVVAKGPIFKVMKILPILSPMYKQYPEVLRQLGHPELAKV
jgi:hypothetical protein